MAYTLKASGLATSAVMILAVDQDGTIKEFVSSDVNTNKVLGTGVAAGVGTSTWKSVARGYFPTFDASFDYNGVKFASGHRPSYTSGGAAISVFIACSSMGAIGSGVGAIIERGSAGSYLASREAASSAINNALVPRHGTTAMPSDNSTKFSAGFSFDDVSGGSKFYYGLESGSLAADGTDASTGYGPGAQDVLGVGGAFGQGSQPGHYHLVAIFNRALSLAEFQSLHGDGTNDWFSTLFNAAGGGTSVTPGVGSITISGFAPTVTQGASRSVAPGVGNIAISGYAPTVAQTVSLVTPVLKNNTGTVLANETGVIVNIYSLTTGALVVRKTGQSSDASGIITIRDASLAAGTTYAYEVVLATNGRRLPTAMVS